MERTVKLILSMAAPTPLRGTTYAEFRDFTVKAATCRALICAVLCLSLAALAGAGPCLAGSPVRVLCMRGPTGMGLAKLMEDAENGASENRYEFQLVSSPEEAVAAVAHGDADIVALPCNMAAILWNRTKGGLSLLSINTLGVLSLLERGNGINSMSDLRGRTIIASGRGATPEFVLNYLLRANGIAPDNDCRVEWMSEHAEVLSGMAAGRGDVCLLPYPFATAAMMKVEGLREALSLAGEWRKLCDGSDFVMGVNVAARNYTEGHKKEIAVFLREARASADYANAHPREASALVVKHGILDNAAIAENALPHCGIAAITGKDMKKSVSGYLKVLFDAEPKSVGGSLPDDEFYYGN